MSEPPSDASALYHERIQATMRSLQARIEHDLWGPPYIKFEDRRKWWAKSWSWVLCRVWNVRWRLAKMLWPHGCMGDCDE